MRPVVACSTLALALALALAACSPSPSATDSPAATAQVTQEESARLNAWFEDQYEQLLQFSPIQLTFLGRKELNDQLDDMSEAGIRKRIDWLQASVREMESTFDYARLDPEAQLSWDLWKRQYESARDGLPFLGNGYPFDQMNGMQNAAPTYLINFHKVDDEQDYLAYVSRLQKLAMLFDQLLERARASAGQGIRPPKFAYEGVIDQSRKVIGGAPFDLKPGQRAVGRRPGQGRRAGREGNHHRRARRRTEATGPRRAAGARRSGLPARHRLRRGGAAQGRRQRRRLSAAPTPTARPTTPTSCARTPPPR